MGPLLPPKPGTIRVPFPANGCPGMEAKACTNTGRQVPVWIPAQNAAVDRQYFCHGHALGTYTRFGYTVFSGGPLQAVLQDEWNLVGSLHNARMGDIVVWFNVHRGAQTRMADHTALIRTVGFGNGDHIDLKRTMLSSKNGTFPLQQYVSLFDLVKIYSDGYALYRHR